MTLHVLRRSAEQDAACAELARNQRRIVERTFADGEIELVLEEVEPLAGQHDVEVEPRMLGGKRGEHGQHTRATERRRGRKPYAPANLLAPLADRGRRFGECFEQRTRALIELEPGI